MPKPHIRIHMSSTYEHTSGCVDGACIENKIGCWNVGGRTVCLNRERAEEYVWFELISGDINDLKKEKE